MLVAKAGASLAKDVSIDESELDLVLAILEVQAASGQITIYVRAVGAACSRAVMRVACTALCVAEADSCAPTRISDTITVRFTPLAQCWRRLAGVTIPRAKLLRHCLVYDSRCCVLTFCEMSEWY